MCCSTRIRIKIKLLYWKLWFKVAWQIVRLVCHAGIPDRDGTGAGVLLPCSCSAGWLRDIRIRNVLWLRSLKFIFRVILNFASVGIVTFDNDISTITVRNDIIYLRHLLCVILTWEAALLCLLVTCIEQYAEHYKKAFHITMGDFYQLQRTFRFIYSISVSTQLRRFHWFWHWWFSSSEPVFRF